MKVQSQHPEWAGLWLKHTERRSRCCSSATFTLFDAVDAQATCTRALRWRFLEATHDGVFSWRLIRGWAAGSRRVHRGELQGSEQAG